MKTSKIEFNEGEAQALVQLMDLAVKSGGIAVAEAALVLTKKMTAAFPAEEAKKEEAPNKK